MNADPGLVMNDSFDLTTIIFAILAVFVVWKLRSVLGTRTGHEEPPFDSVRRPPAPERAGDGPSDQNVVRLPGAAADVVTQPSTDERKSAWAKAKDVDPALLPALEQIAVVDPNFEPRSFMEGAKGAYELIVMSFAAGNRAGLRDLLSKDVFESFSGAIGDRETRGETVDTTFVSIDKVAIVDATLKSSLAQVSLRFQSKLITATRDRAGAVIDGNPDKVVDMVDVWTFARETNSRDPNWKLVATEAGA